MGVSVALEAGEQSQTMVWKSDASKYEHLRPKLKTIIVATAVAAIVTAVWMQSIVFPLLLAAVVAHATSPIWLQAKYKLDEKNASSGFAQIPWRDVRRVIVDGESVHLSPFEKESRLDAFRGVKLDTQNVSKAEILSFVKERVGENVRFLGE